MGFTTVIAVVALLIFSVVFVIPILTNITDIQDKGLICGALGLCIESVEDSQKYKDEVEKQQTEAELRRPSTDGKVICDLAVSVRADLVEDFGRSPYIKIDTSDARDYQWYCQFPNQWGVLNNLTNGLQKLFWANSDEFIHAELKLIQQSDTSKWFDANDAPDYSSMYREIRLTDTTGIVQLPLNMDQSFYIENIPHDNYILEIYYGREINNLGAGNPLDETVCKVGTTC